MEGLFVAWYCLPKLLHCPSWLVFSDSKAVFVLCVDSNVYCFCRCRCFTCVGCRLLIMCSASFCTNHVGFYGFLVPESSILDLYVFYFAFSRYSACWLVTFPLLSCICFLRFVGLVSFSSKGLSALSLYEVGREIQGSSASDSRQSTRLCLKVDIQTSTPYDLSFLILPLLLSVADVFQCTEWCLLASNLEHNSV